jgi:hypothetical protein
MSVFKISKNVPIPSDLAVSRQFYPWTEMEPGDSFFVRNAKVTAMTAKAAWAGRQYHKQYVCRTVKGGVRVWCIGHRDPSAPRKRNSWNKRQHEASLPTPPAGDEESEGR